MPMLGGLDPAGVSSDRDNHSFTGDRATQSIRDPTDWAARSRRVLFRSETLSIAVYGDPVRLVLAGEIDIGNVADLTAALSEAADGSGVLHIDMADVVFFDLAGLRTLTGLRQHTDGQQQPARQVVLHRLPVRIHKLLRILEWDNSPGLTVDTNG
jgi:anti-anti-sigma factor